MKTFTFDAIGTRWSIDVYDSLPENRVEKLMSSIRQRITLFEETYSRFLDTSLVSQMALRSGDYTLPPDSIPIFALYKQLYELTNGSFTPLIGRALEEAGYDKDYSLKPQTIQAVPTWEETISLNGTSMVLHKPALLDIGAIGKGALIDIVGSILQDGGIQAYCIDAGGDMLYRNTTDRKMRVGLEHPANADQVIGVTEILNQSIAASAGNRRAWKGLHHILDPKTRKPVNTILGSWIIAENAMLADALATAVFFAEPELLRAHFQFSYLILKPGMKVLKSDDFPGELYYTDISENG